MISASDSKIESTGVILWEILASPVTGGVVILLDASSPSDVVVRTINVNSER